MTAFRLLVPVRSCYVGGSGEKRLVLLRIARFYRPVKVGSSLPAAQGTEIMLFGSIFAAAKGEFETSFGMPKKQ